MTSKTVAAFLLLLLLLSPSRADIIADATLSTDYIYRGLDNLNGGPAFQPTVTYVSPKTGIDLNAWFNWGLSNRGQSTIRDFDEVDLTASWTREVGNIALRTGVFHLSWYERDNFPDDFSTVNEVFAGVSFLQVPMQPSLTVNYELAETDGHDLYIQARCGFERPIGVGPALFFGLSAGYYAADWVGKDGISDINLEIATTLMGKMYAVTPKFMVTYAPMDEINPNHLILWSSLTLTRVWMGGN